VITALVCPSRWLLGASRLRLPWCANLNDPCGRIVAVTLTMHALVRMLVVKAVPLESERAGTFAPGRDDSVAPNYDPI
jgi:hypothetical protein